MKNALIFILIAVSLAYLMYHNKYTDASRSLKPTANIQADKPQPQLSANESIKSLQITAQDCAERLPTIESAEFLKSKYIATISRWLNTQPEQQTIPQSKYQLARAMGINTAEYDMFYVKSAAKTANEQKLKSLTPKQIIAVMGYINTSNYEQLATDISTGLIPLTGLIIGEPILTTIFESDPDLTVNELSSLLDAGIKVTLKDIQFITKHTTHLDMIQRVTAHSELQPNLSWHASYGQSNLISLAIKSLNPISLKFWLTQYDTDAINFKTIYSNLPTPFGKKETQSAIAIVNALAAVGQLTLTPIEFQQLKFWYPQNRIADLNLSILNSMDIEFNAAQLELSQRLANTRQQILESKALEENCEAQHQVTRKDDKNYSEGLHVKSLNSNISQQKTLAIVRQKTLAAFKSGIPEQRQQQAILFKEVFRQSYQKQWPEALASVEELIKSELNNEEDPNTKQYYDFLLTQAVYHEAPESFINQLFAKGATLADTVILTLAMNNNVSMAQFLLNHNLNLHYVDENGKNAVSQSILSSHRQIFEFLTSHQVAIESTTQQFDSLNYALQQVGRSHAAIAFVEQLLFRGKTVDNSHKQQLELIQIQQPELYKRLEPLFN